MSVKITSQYGIHQKAGFPPIIIPNEHRRQYIELLAHYEISVGQLSNTTGAWPDVKQLKDFEVFCHRCYQETLDIINFN